MPSGPSTCGATIRCSRSTSPLAHKRRVQRRRRPRPAASKRPIASKRLQRLRRSDRGLDDDCARRCQRGRRGRPASPLARMPSRIMTGPSSSVENSRAVGGVRSRRSNTTRTSGRTRWHSRAVSSGSSTSTVSDPTAMASTAARSSCVLRFASRELIGVRCARAARERASRLVAAFSTTSGRPASCTVTNACVQPRAPRPRRRPSSTAMPWRAELVEAAARSRADRDRCIAATTRAMPASMIAPRARARSGRCGSTARA